MQGYIFIFYISISLLEKFVVLYRHGRNTSTMSNNNNDSKKRGIIMKLKTFKKYFVDTRFKVSVWNKSEKAWGSFIADYCMDTNIDRIVELYSKEAKVLYVSYNQAEHMNEITVEVE